MDPEMPIVFAPQATFRTTGSAFMTFTVNGPWGLALVSGTEFARFSLVCVVVIRSTMPLREL